MFIHASTKESIKTIILSSLFLLILLLYFVGGFDFLHRQFVLFNCC